MDEETFIKKNKNDWEKLAAYNRRLSKKSITRLEPGELREFAGLLRAAGHHLAYARTRFSGRRGDTPESLSKSETENYLNRLVGLAHNHFYTREKFGFARIKNYFVKDFPRRVADEKRLFFISAAAFLTGAAFVYFMCAIEPSLASFFIPEDPGFGGAGGGNWFFPLLSSFVVTNNIRVAAMAFASGFFAGAGTLYILLANGGVIGAYLYSATTGGIGAGGFWPLILPHGIAELTAIFISGAAGLMIGRAIISPGNYKRSDAMLIASKRAAYLLPGAAAILLFAGLVEGFFTPLDIANAYKYAFAALSAAFFIFYFTFSAKRGV